MSMKNAKTNTNANTQTNTNTKCFKDPIYAIFLKSWEFKDFKYDMDIRVSQNRMFSKNWLTQI